MCLLVDKSYKHPQNNAIKFEECGSLDLHVFPSCKACQGEGSAQHHPEQLFVGLLVGDV